MRRIINGDPWRKSRLHDMRGQFIGMRGVCRDLPRVLLDAALREGAGVYPSLPWIPYPAIRALANLIQPDWRVLEHGAGMSTIWFAERAGCVHSIEANSEWFARVSEKLQRRKLENVTFELRKGDHYSDLSELPSGAFNLVLIDGHARERVAEQAPRLIARPGYIYLDNTDFAAQWPEMYGEAELSLRRAAQRDGAIMQYFVGFPPATFPASEGLLVSFP